MAKSRGSIKKWLTGSFAIIALVLFVASLFYYSTFLGVGFILASIFWPLSILITLLVFMGLPINSIFHFWSVVGSATHVAKEESKKKASNTTTPMKSIDKIIDEHWQKKTAFEGVGHLSRDSNKLGSSSVTIWIKGNCIYYRKFKTHLSGRKKEVDKQAAIKPTGFYLKGCVCQQTTVDHNGSEVMAAHIYHPLANTLSESHKTFYLFVYCKGREVELAGALSKFCSGYESYSKLTTVKAWKPAEWSEGKESAIWFNSLLSRMFLTLNKSTKIQSMLFKRIAGAIEKQIEKKNLQSLVTDVVITNLALNKPPVLSNIQLVTPGNEDQSGDLCINADMEVVDSLTVSVRLVVQLSFQMANLAKIATNMTISLEKLSGPVSIRIPPFPSDKLVLAFHKEPELSLGIDVEIGRKGSQNHLLKKTADTLKYQVRKAVQAMIRKKLVLPNRKVLPIPMSNKPKSKKKKSEVAFKVRQGSSLEYTTVLPDNPDSEKLADGLSNICDIMFDNESPKALQIIGSPDVQKHEDQNANDGVVRHKHVRKAFTALRKRLPLGKLRWSEEQKTSQ